VKNNLPHHRLSISPQRLPRESLSFQHPISETPSSPSGKTGEVCWSKQRTRMHCWNGPLHSSTEKRWPHDLIDSFVTSKQTQAPVRQAESIFAQGLKLLPVLAGHCHHLLRANRKPALILKQTAAGHCLRLRAIPACHEIDPGPYFSSRSATLRIGNG